MSSHNLHCKILQIITFTSCLKKWDLFSITLPKQLAPKICPGQIKTDHLSIITISTKIHIKFKIFKVKLNFLTFRYIIFIFNAVKK